MRMPCRSILNRIKIIVSGTKHTKIHEGLQMVEQSICYEYSVNACAIWVTASVVSSWCSQGCTFGCCRCLPALCPVGLRLGCLMLHLALALLVG